MDIKFGSEESGEINLPKTISLKDLLTIGKDIAELKSISLTFPGGRSVEFNLYEMSDRVDTEVNKNHISVADYSQDYFNFTVGLTASDLRVKMTKEPVNEDAMEFGLVTYSAESSGMKISVSVIDINFEFEQSEEE